MDILQFLFYVIFFFFVFLCTFIYATYLILSQMSKPSKQFKTSSWRESSDSKLISPRNLQIYESCCEFEIDHPVYWYQLLHHCGRALYMSYSDCDTKSYNLIKGPLLSNYESRFVSFFLAPIGAQGVTLSVCLSICLSVCLSVRHKVL